MSTSEVRQRNVNAPASYGWNGSKDRPRLKPGAENVITALTILRLLVTGLVFSAVLSYFVVGDVFWGRRPQFTRTAYVMAKLRGDVRLSLDELAAYDGSDATKAIYLALNGTIYDVSANARTYGPGGSYHFFAGRDATRAFVTGCFADDLTGDVRGLEEMYVPLDLDEPPGPEPGLDEAARRRRRGEWKMRRDRAWRDGRARVRDVIAGWEATYNGGKGGRYFRVGTVVGAVYEGEKLKLCRKALESRPKTGAVEG